MKISTRIKKTLAIIGFITLCYGGITLYSYTYDYRLLPWVLSFLFLVSWIIILSLCWPTMLNEETPPSKKSLLLQRIMGITGILGGAISIIVLIANILLISQMYHAHYTLGLEAAKDTGFGYTFIKTTIILFLGLGAGSIGFLTLLVGNKNIYRWLGVAGGMIPIVCVILFFVTPIDSRLYIGRTNKNEPYRHNFSMRVHGCQQAISGFSLSDEWIESILETIPYRSEKYKPGLSMEEQKSVITDLSKWWQANRNYLIWEENKFILDQEAQTAGIPTDEYRKTHPWPKTN